MHNKLGHAVNKPIFLIVLFLACFCLGCNNNQYHVLLDNTYGLGKGDPVIIKGKEVGAVKSVELKGEKIVVTITLNKNLHIYPNSKVVAKDISLLGDKAIEIIYSDNNKQAALMPNDTITGSYEGSYIFTHRMNTKAPLVDTVRKYEDTTAKHK